VFTLVSIPLTVLIIPVDRYDVFYLSVVLMLIVSVNRCSQWLIQKCVLYARK